MKRLSDKLLKKLNNNLFPHFGKFDLNFEWGLFVSEGVDFFF
jgi:hypothetical protein